MSLRRLRRLDGGVGGLVDFAIDVLRRSRRGRRRSRGPASFSNAANFVIGSRVASSARSPGVLYSRSSSESECEYGRMTLAWTSAGPLRARGTTRRPRSSSRSWRRRRCRRSGRRLRPGNDSTSARDAAAGRLHFDRHGDRVAVVLDEEDDRQLAHAGRVQRFPELALARRAVAERDVDDLVAARTCARGPGCP